MPRLIRDRTGNSAGVGEEGYPSWYSSPSRRRFGRLIAADASLRCVRTGRWRPARLATDVVDLALEGGLAPCSARPQRCLRATWRQTNQ
jgi:hypothetical protein